MIKTLEELKEKIKKLFPKTKLIHRCIFGWSIIIPELKLKIVKTAIKKETTIYKYNIVFMNKSENLVNSLTLNQVYKEIVKKYEKN